MENRFITSCRFCIVAGFPSPFSFAASFPIVTVALLPTGAVFCCLLRLLVPFVRCWSLLILLVPVTLVLLLLTLASC